MAQLSQTAEYIRTLPTENVALQVFQAFESTGECLLPFAIYSSIFKG